MPFSFRIRSFIFSKPIPSVAEGDCKVPLSWMTSCQSAGCSRMRIETAVALLCLIILERASFVIERKAYLMVRGTVIGMSYSSVIGQKVKEEVSSSVTSFKLTESSCKSWTLVRILSIARDNVSVSCLSGSCNDSSLLIVLMAPDRRIARESIWPTLSWISLAIRLRSCKVAV